MDDRAPAAPALPFDGLSAALFETAQCLVCVLDRAGRIVLWNRACEEATGWTSAEAVGRDARELVIPADELADFDSVLERVFASGVPSPELGHWRTRDGATRLVAWANKPLAGAGGEDLLVTAGLDLTEREQATAELRRLLEEQGALRRVATLVASQPDAENVLHLVSVEAGLVLGAEASAVVRFGADETATVVGRWSSIAGRGVPVGSVLDLNEPGTTATVWRTGERARTDRYDGVGGRAATLIRGAGYTSTVGAPIVAAGRLWGALILGTSAAEPFPPETESRLSAFAELVSLAVASAEAWERLLESRARLVEAADAERRRLERNLHDGAQQRLVSLALSLRLARSRLDVDPGGAAELLDGSLAELEQALAELRELARGLHPALLGDRGLEAALLGLARRAPLPVAVEAPAERLPAAVEAAIYYVVAEALTNVAKHAGASEASVRVTVEPDGRVVAEIRDDGGGEADVRGGSGLAGLHDRVEALRGTLAVESDPGAGTTVRAELPAPAGA